MDELRIALTQEERDATSVVAFIFRGKKDGGMSITEEWDEMDEIYSNGVNITIPARVWIEAMAWFPSPPGDAT